jgi:hypothetical protein
VFKQSKTRLLAALSGIAAVALVGAAPAFADSAVGAQNPSLEVRASMVSSGVDPEIGMVGDYVTTSLSVTNKSEASQFVHIYLQSEWIRGRNLNRDFFRTLSPGETWSLDAKLQVYRDMPVGLYNIGIQAFGIGLLAPSEAFAGMNVTA